MGAAAAAAAAALAGAVVGGLVTFLTTVYQNRQAQDAREKEAQVSRKARAAEVLGLVRVFLTDADPARLAYNLQPDQRMLAMTRWQEELADLTARFNTLRGRLSVFAAEAYDEELATRAAELEVALVNAFDKARRHVRDLTRASAGGGEPEASYEVAAQAHRHAGLLVALVLGLVHGRDVSAIESTLDKPDRADTQG